MKALMVSLLTEEDVRLPGKKLFKTLFWGKVNKLSEDISIAAGWMDLFLEGLWSS